MSISLFVNPFLSAQTKRQKTTLQHHQTLIDNSALAEVDILRSDYLGSVN